MPRAFVLWMLQTSLHICSRDLVLQGPFTSCLFQK
uniref:Uncharacterized protein n=1 Tax=Arundo donax TaxID=35708 RepID=A0A0A9FK35_ARUDO